MKKMIRTAALAATMAFGLAGNAQAQDIQPYAGAGIGYFSINSDILGITNSTGSAVGGFGTLGVEFNENLAAELRIGATGKAAIFGTNYYMSPFFTYLLKGSLPIGENASVYGLIGGTTGTIKTDLGLNESHTGVSFGIGASMPVQDNLDIGAEYLRYWHNVGVANGVAQIDMDGLSLTLNYKF